MKLLYLNHVAYLGGAEVALLNLLTDLDRDRYAPTVCCPAGPLAEAVQAMGVRWRPIPRLHGLNRWNLPRFVGRLPTLAAAIRRESPDIIHANTNCASQYAGLLGRWRQIPTMGHIRDIEPLGRMGRRAIRQPTRLIAISEAVVEFLTQEGIPQHRMTKIHDGVDLAQYIPQSAPMRPRPGPLIGIIAQLGQRKGHHVLLEAVNELVADFPALRLWIVGQEPRHSRERYTERLRTYVHDHQLDQHVSFQGFRPDIPDILARLDIVVVPSLQEPFGKVVIEGMAMQKPVIASAVGGIPEIVVPDETGLLVPPGDAAALRRALQRLLRDPDLRIRMGTRGRQRVEALFTSTRNVQQTELVYEQLCGEEQP